MAADRAAPAPRSAPPHAMDPSDPYAAWLGRTEERRDTVTPTPVAALAATLDRDDPAPAAGTRAAAALALALLPAAGTAERDRRRRPSAPRRLPAAGDLAAPHVGGRPALVPAAAARRRRDDAHLAHRQHRREAGALRAARLRHRRARDRDRGRRRAARGARHRLPRPAGTGRDRDPGGRADRRDLLAPDRPRRRAPLSLFGAHLQRPPHPLRPPLRHRGRGLSGPDRPRPADRDPAGRPAAARAARGGAASASTSRRSARCSTCIPSPSAADPTASGASRSGRAAPKGALAMQATAEIA